MEVSSVETDAQSIKDRKNLSSANGYLRNYTSSDLHLTGNINNNPITFISKVLPEKENSRCILFLDMEDEIEKYL